ncbi:hypothetical protein CSPX01_11147 [Colletotrichum filicis]|nr:hypothetical protein CSPX01_11147 [Colletotrichum filicis]
MPTWYLVPNTTHKHPSKDYEFRRYFYSAYANGRRPDDLEFRGYFRALCIYGGEESFIRATKSGKRVGEILRENETFANRLRSQAIDRGYTQPDTNTIRFTIFWSRDTFDTTTDEAYARRIFSENPQPPHVFKRGRLSLPISEKWDRATIPWSPALPSDHEPIAGNREPTADDREHLADDPDLDSLASDTDWEFESQSPEDSCYFTPLSNNNMGDSGRRSTGHAPLTVTPTRSRTQIAALDSESIKESLLVLESFHEACNRLRLKRMTTKVFIDTIVSLHEKNPDAGLILREFLEGKTTSQSLSGSQMATQLMNSAREKSRKRQAIDLTGEGAGEDASEDTHNTPFTSDTRRLLFSKASSSKSPITHNADNTTPLGRTKGTGLGSDKARSLTLQKNFYKFLAQGMSDHVDPSPQVIDWGQKRSAIILYGEGFIDTPIVCNALHVFITNMISQGNLIASIRLMKILGILGLSIDTARFTSTNDAAEPKGFKCAQEKALLTRADDRNPGETMGSIVGAALFGAKHGWDTLYGTKDSDLSTWIEANVNLEDAAEYLGMSVPELEAAIDEKVVEKRMGQDLG